MSAIELKETGFPPSLKVFTKPPSAANLIFSFFSSGSGADEPP
jgi:hypothetical protein